jgi:hypothetical protein
MCHNKLDFSIHPLRYPRTGFVKLGANGKIPNSTALAAKSGSIVLPHPAICHAKTRQLGLPACLIRLAIRLIRIIR